MINRLSSLTRFLILTSGLFAILAAVLIFTSNIIVRNSFITRSKLAIASAIQFESKDLRAEDFSLKDPDHARGVFNNFYERIKNNEIIRIKVWDYSGKVIFSDDRSIVGKRFPDNGEFKEALKGEVVTEIGQKVKTENISEQGYQQLLEVYVPITFKGESVPSGVIEAYFKLDDVNSRIRETQIVLIMTIVAFTLVSFGILFVVFKMVIYKQIERIRLQAMALDNASDHVIITDLNGIILYVNKAAEKLTGYTKSEMVGKRPSLWGKQMPTEFYKKMWNTIKIEKKDFMGEITNRRIDGTEYEAEMKISPILDSHDNVTFFVGIERDITHEKEINRAKTEFISLASHQLRTPLSAMRWFAEMLLGGDAGKLTPKQKEYIQSIYDSNNRLITLVNALLDISRIESGRLIIGPEPTDLRELINAAIADNKSNIEEKKMNISLSIEDNLPKINIDPKLIYQVYMNLLSNSIKYTGVHGQIQIFIYKQGAEIVSQVTDTGLGIPQKDQSKVFTRFFRAENILKVATGGTGLGLYLAKAIVESSGGRFWFESPVSLKTAGRAGKAGKGTTFWFSLPATGSKANEGEVTLGS